MAVLLLMLQEIGGWPTIGLHPRFVIVILNLGVNHLYALFFLVLNVSKSIYQFHFVSQ